ncbi:hypothetical protein Btru_052864 [Bulinus truncatus]|nr:hypothetical protein Btru_052864 [Bulinus truncatus]
MESALTFYYVLFIIVKICSVKYMYVIVSVASFCMIRLVRKVLKNKINKYFFYHDKPIMGTREAVAGKWEADAFRLFLSIVPVVRFVFKLDRLTEIKTEALANETLENGKDSPIWQPLLLSKMLLERRSPKEVLQSSKVVLEGVDRVSYSGYITVDQHYDSNLFFWFFPASKVSIEQSPLLIYLNGGPGNSSMIGLFEEIGPLMVSADGQVSERLVHWTDTFSVVFVDNPVGVGFSFCQSGGESKTNQDVADNLYTFLTQFLQLYPKCQHSDLYIGGQSYAGKYVPAFAYKIHTEMMLAESEVTFNLRGIFIGGGLCDPSKMLPLFPELLINMGMVSEKKGKDMADKIRYAKDKHNHLSKHQEAIMDILECVFSIPQKTLGYKELDNLLLTKEYKWHFPSFLNRKSIQQAIHARPTQYSLFTDKVLTAMSADFLSGVATELETILDSYKVLIFTGQMDMVVSVPMVEVFLKDLNWSGKEEYSEGDKMTWTDDHGDVAGYVTQVSNFTRVILRNAGHRASIDQPSWVLNMMTNFINDISF